MRLSKIHAFALAVLFVAAPTFAAKKKPAPAPTPDPAKQAAMQQAMKMGAPNEAHKFLEQYVGRWAATVAGRMGPDEPFQQSTGTALHVMSLGGRFLSEEFRGWWAGQPFEGHGAIGYNNMTGEYESVWLDNFMTGMMKATGSYDAASKTLTIGGTFACPMTGNKSEWFRSEWKVVDPDTTVYTSYSQATGGKEYKSMEITYKRVK